MTIDQMIEVLEAFKRGEKIEYYGCGEWLEAPDQPMFNFGNITYRIAKPEPKKVKLHAWLTPTGALVWYDMSKVETWSTDCIRIPEEDKEITLP